MVRILGLIDILAAVLLVFSGVNHGAPIISAIIVSVILLFKAFASPLSIAGIIDIFAAIMLVLGVSANPPFLILIISAILVGQKGLASMFSYS